MTKRYEVQLEVAGPAAMFARPDTGATPTSYPVPTYSACKGIFESIAWLNDGSAWIRPKTVEVCRHISAPGGEVRFQRYTTNYGGPLRKADQLRKGNNFQLIATILTDVCYRLHGDVVGESRHPRRRNNVRHYLKDLFDRRLRQGRCHRTPCLGWSEFTATYWGAFRDEFVVDSELTIPELPSMLFQMWDRPVNGRYAPQFVQRVAVEKGVLRFAQ